MKILKYTPENLEAIASAKESSLEEVSEEFDEANRVDLTIYSVIDFETFGNKTRKVLPNARFVAGNIIDEHYIKVEPEQPGTYTAVEVKHNRSK